MTSLPTGNRKSGTRSPVSDVRSLHDCVAFWVPVDNSRGDDIGIDGTGHS